MIADPTDPKLFHMFVSRMAGHCGLNSWQENSEIVHATATDAEGPYSYHSTVMSYFAHGPSVRAYGGGYLMMHLGCGRSFMPYRDQCRNGTTPAHAEPTHDDAVLCNQFNVSIMTAKSLYGPWSSTDGGEQVYLSSGSTPAAKSWFVPSGRQFSNPAPFVKRDGSIMCAYRADARSGGEHVSVAVAATAAGPYTDERLHPAVASHSGEDPYLYQDERGHYHMLMHNMGGGCGSHAFSRDGVDWTRSGDEPYTFDVAFSDGSATKMHRRERPQLLLSPTGQPRFFSSGVEDEADHTYTLVMKFNVSE
jgi:hypothetical protein